LIKVCIKFELNGTTCGEVIDDLLTSNFCCRLRVTWSKSAPNVYEIEQTAAELLII